MDIKYECKKGLTIKGDVQKLAIEIYNIENKTPQILIDYAKENKESVLFRQFEWDNGEAAKKYRKQQARLILNHLIIKTIDEEEINIGAFPSVQIEDENIDTSRVYLNIVDAIEDKNQRGKIMSDIKMSIQQFCNKLDAYNNLVSFLLEKHK